MPKKSETKRASTRPSRQPGQGRSTKGTQGRQKQSETEMHRGEEKMDTEQE